MTVLTKQQAAAAQIDAAIRAYKAADHASAITLAAAAEGAMPEADDAHLFAIIRDVFAGSEERSRKREQKVVAFLNLERDWLKHYNEAQPERMDLSGSLLYIVRAYSRYHAVYGRHAETNIMKEFMAEAREWDPFE